jgi:hypothetical protein
MQSGARDHILEAIVDLEGAQTVKPKRRPASAAPWPEWMLRGRTCGDRSVSLMYLISR